MMANAGSRIRAALTTEAPMTLRFRDCAEG